jgi:DNA (cytosine-5)-methyltransferase 1
VFRSELSQGDLRLSYERQSDVVSMIVQRAGESHCSALEASSLSSNSHHAWWHGYAMGSHIQFPASQGTLRIADLFCGPGGLSQGFRLGSRVLGFKTQHQLAVDVDRDALRVYAANHRPRLALNESTASLVSYALQENSEGVRFTSLPLVRDERVAALRGQLDVLLAGPPCQGHSTANSKRRFFDQRNLLYLTVPALAIALDIPVVVIENVPGVRASQQGVVQTTWKLLEGAGYSVTGGVLNASDLGWAQSRKRYFMIASRGSQPLDVSRELLPALRRPPMAISDLLGDLVAAEPDGFMTELPELSVENRRRIDFLHDQDLYDLPDEHRNKKARESGTTYRSVYGRMYWDKPAQTITTGFLTPGRGRYVHPIARRTLLPLEAARLQGFPDDYVFNAFGETPNRTALAKWIGDAVPAPLGFAAAISALARKV